MSRNRKDTKQKEILKKYEDLMENLANEHPDIDVYEVIKNNKAQNTNKTVGQSEYLKFMSQAEERLGTEFEINFNDLEKGLHNALTKDARSAIEDYIEKIPVEAPIGVNGKLMKNCGHEKKKE